ncbi:MAG TPA: hypothetical protein PKC45_05990, partial [Gemmatales bacterium]|nr:hypothetical protein [Gemmatales bacterium]
MARRPKASAAQQLFYEALVMEDSAAKLATLLEAARHADAEGDTDLGFLIRNEVLSAGLMCGAGREMLVNYAWCLARADAEPDRFPLEDVLFQYRWVIFEAAELLEITRDQVHELLADITRRYQAYGISLRSVYVLQRACALELGDVALATLSHAKWRRARIDFWSDHESIESIFLVSYFLFKGQLSRALQAAQSHLNGCETDPHSLTCAFGELVLPVALRGDLEL